MKVFEEDTSETTSSSLPRMGNLRAAGLTLQGFVAEKVAPDFDRLAHMHCVTRKNMVTHLKAAAELARRHQEGTEEAIRQWITSQHAAGGLEAVALLEFLEYDETPLPCRVRSEVADGAVTHREKSKLFVVDLQWACVLRLAALHCLPAMSLPHSWWSVARGHLALYQQNERLLKASRQSLIKWEVPSLMRPAGSIS